MSCDTGCKRMARQSMSNSRKPLRTSPFGTKKRMPVFLERSILELPKIYINGGRRGFLVGLAPGEIVRILAPALVTVALED